MIRKLLVALSLVAMVLIPVFGINAQTVAESGTNTETFEEVNSTGEDVTLVTDEADNYDDLFSFSVYNATSSTELIDSTDYILDGQNVVILADQITTDSTIEVTYNYVIFETSPTSDFEGSASGLISDTVSDLGSTLMMLLRPILMLVAVLIALFFGVKLIRKWIGGSRG